MDQFSRRQFVRGAVAAPALITPARADGAGVTLVIPAGDAVVNAPPSLWAVAELEAALVAAGCAVKRAATVAEAPRGDLCVLASSEGAPASPEALSLATVRRDGRSVLRASGHDPRGLVYALLELADRVRHAAGPDALRAALAVQTPIVERPANRIRGVARLFTSDVEDKPWFNDREMWPAYLSMLAAQRFNRFQLSLGIGYDFLRNVTDAYFVFAYPFLLPVEGYNVRVPQLPDAERDRNLAMLRYISEQTALRGMRFQLGLWMHGYEWLESPHPNYTIAGLTRETHAAYCRDAVRALLRACPSIGGITFRVHGESGVEEGSYQFWKSVFEGVATCGRTVEIDMHAKGMDQGMIDLALASGMPIVISPKYWAEHLGMPYHQADIRELERPRAGRNATGLMKLSSGSRSFLRYGYGDLLREDRRWGVLHRIWPGTQRLLLSGDPVTAAAHSRSFSFCGSDGVEIMEPLSFKGRRGSGIAGDRCGYADRSLSPRWDWEKYAYGHRVWGRLLYNPDTDAAVWRRYLTAKFGAGGAPMQAALANASRILPIVTTAHGASAANNNYWPEMYLNQSLVDAEHSEPYRDSPARRVFGNVSPFDPQLFSRINDYADELLRGERGARYSPVEVAQWIEDYAAAAQRHLAEAAAGTAAREGLEYRRASIDVAIAAGLGAFFGAKFRAGVLYRIYELSGDRTALEAAIGAYRRARTAWAGLAERARGVYVRDVTVGELPQLRGHWLDRLPAIDADIAALEQRLTGARTGTPDEHVRLAIEAAHARPHRELAACRHTPPARLVPGAELPIELTVAADVVAVRLWYRHVTQAERYEQLAMRGGGHRYTAEIPGGYTDSAYPLAYYFEVIPRAKVAFLYPGFNEEQTNQPYFVVRSGAGKM